MKTKKTTTTKKYFQYIPFKEGWYFLQKFLLIRYSTDQIFILMFLNHKWCVIKYAFQSVIRVNWLTPLLSEANLFVKVSILCNVFISSIEWITWLCYLFLVRGALLSWNKWTVSLHSYEIKTFNPWIFNWSSQLKGSHFFLTAQ